MDDTDFHLTARIGSYASWLNMVEIEVGVLKRQCLSRRISERETLVREITAWQKRRNETTSWGASTGRLHKHAKMPPRNTNKYHKSFKFTATRY